MKKNYRHTKVVFTLGPATAEEEVIKKLILEGVDICRLNMAHSSHQWVQEKVSLIRKCCKEVKRQIAFMMDIKGPEIRSGVLEEPITLAPGDFFTFFMNKEGRENSDEQGVDVNYPCLVDDIKVGSTVLVDSGLIQMTAIEKSANALRCQVVTPGTMSSKRHINLPGTHVQMDSLTQKDKDDLDVGIELGLDFYALSFVRDAESVDLLRSYLAQNGSRAKIISKIEEQSGIQNIDDIIKTSDSIMIARGDLGIECPYDEIPIIQQNIINKCIQKGKPVIVATHMLESMITNPIPTRSEVSDVATAVVQHADCIMLSGESSVGKYPLECVKVMNRISLRMEESSSVQYTHNLKLKTPKEKMLRSAVQLAADIGKTGILVFTRNGRLPKTLSQLRPKGCPIYAFTNNEKVFRRMLIMWGIEPFLLPFDDHDYQDTIAKAFGVLLKAGWVKEVDLMVVVTNVLIEGKKIVDTVQLRPASEGLMLSREQAETPEEQNP